MSVYIAPKRKQSIFATVLEWLTYPLTLLRYPLGWLIGQAVLPATNMDFNPAWYPRSRLEIPPYGVSSISYPEIETSDGARLETLELISPEQALKSPSEQHYVIFFNGNGMDLTDSLGDALGYMHEGHFNTVMFNYRGVGGLGAKPLSSDDLITDGIAQVQRLLDMGIPSKNIILRGISLGGGVATKVAEYFYLQEEKPIYVFNDRSFSSLQNVVIGHIRQLFNTEPFQDDTMAGKILGYIAYPIVWGVLQFASWEIEASKAFKQIPPEYRDYAVVRTPKKNRLKQEDDFVITHFGSLHEDLADERALNKEKLKQLKSEAPEQQEEIQQLERELKHHKYEDRISRFSHMESPRHLKNRSGLTLHQEFSMFAKKAFQSEEPTQQNKLEL